MTQLDVCNLTSLTTTSIDGCWRQLQIQTHYHQLPSERAHYVLTNVWTSLPPCEWIVYMIAVCTYMYHTRWVSSPRFPWHAVNWPVVSCTAFHGLMTSSGSVTSRSKSPRGLNCLTLGTLRHVTIRLWSAFTERPQGSSFASHIVAQESCAIANLTAQCAPYMGALKIFGAPGLYVAASFPNFRWAFVLIHPMNVHTKFKVRSFSRSWNKWEYPKNMGSPWICPRSLLSKIFNGL